MSTSVSTPAINSPAAVWAKNNTHKTFCISTVIQSLPGRLLTIKRADNCEMKMKSFFVLDNFRNNCSQPLIDAFHQFVTHLVFVEKQMSDRHCGPVSLLCDYKSTWQLRNENNFQNCHCIMAGSHKRFLFYT